VETTDASSTGGVDARGIVPRGDPRANGSRAAVLLGGAVGATGASLIVVGLRARREVRAALARERITPIGPETKDGFVSSAREARALAEFIRQSTLRSTADRTYAETDAYLDADGNPTGDATLAAKESNGRPVANPDHSLWIESTTLQVALLQSYLAFRLADLMLALGGSFAAAGASMYALGRRRRV
jgi:hypothetical protein